jgi:hypothetical protein
MRLVIDALRVALGQREPGAEFRPVYQPDAGSPVHSGEYTHVLDDRWVLASIGWPAVPGQRVGGMVRGLLLDRADRRPGVTSTERS